MTAAGPATDPAADLKSMLIDRAPRGQSIRSANARAAADAYNAGSPALLQAIDKLLAHSAALDGAIARELAAELRGYRRGRADGYLDGYRQGAANSDADWVRCLAPARAEAGRLAREPTFAQIEIRRWGPGGRAHFGDPRPSDYKGLHGAASGGDRDEDECG